MIQPPAVFDAAGRAWRHAATPRRVISQFPPCSVRRHGNPERGLPGEPYGAEDRLIIGIVWLQMDVIVIHALHQVVPRYAVLADERRAGESHVHITGQLFGVLLGIRLEGEMAGPPPVDAGDSAFRAIQRPGWDL